MIKEMDYSQDDKTVLLDRRTEEPARGPLTDLEEPPRFEHLEQRMIYAARLRPAEAINIGLNPLVSAAAELLSEVVRLKHSPAGEELQGLNQRLSDGVRQFELLALQDGADNGQVMAARYVLCTVLDEAVVTTAWGNESEWAQMSLLSNFHNETFGGEKFFQLLEQVTRNPVKHLHMLELMYLCLALGFEGKYRVLPRGLLELEAIRDSLYRQIRQLRGDVPRELSPHWEGLRDQRRGLVRIVPWWLVALFTLVCLGVIYSGFAWVLGEQRESVLQPYQQLDPAAVEPTS
ncbi:type IVB secretion system protein IcmH/DotU [Pseudomonas sp. R3.Fl]|uniref:type IVB secretion system protein IcmH/DotU n=1 Tax=Pseudomonas TaxID=286 RepID=UPI000E2F4413|nr:MULTISPECIES: type IVB secretion system protein IcmH/DotU [Pseudomonas]MCL6691277.1 type IVB secretion system protein IcmH/DotU [Pseudomonas sp. R3.Fl]MCP1605501.1 type VI secretion system protein ImpK [Pseudomonas citronellolis]MCP1642192.1 type VI secretion system protein ImpK [Pseudomonas citronellolis]MCP1658878.1 type VI secretion system protein ImpK [Pseudomonas citronellolis]MCP1668856.1 type VI secretion system protein ImpK [Pseudomonas citronellolis]